MDLDELTAFAKEEHERLVAHFNVRDNPKTKYTMFAKLVEEVGELSEAILSVDGIQRSDKPSMSKEEIGSELADIILVAMILGQELGIDVKEALGEKIAKIRGRTY